ncbi:tripartite tricarboxylate transporter substrate binding protein [Fulvimarina endophytica]|uniref:Tripartite tricarboxylate transporter substrate binding protein n=1 Tax=Fulvimarina endophytica TaxID=2293836 RepID=A0A371X598_9HYPH|nr:tripartite tricarboxylate transporter substrate binding protein [Fulvimarina endophytica]RFC64408.1 tripartite tricarboxylate transporter substrate binding protein [Fulvimarina endophytica]
MFERFKTTSCLAAIVCAGMASSAAAQEFPQQPVNLVVPFNAGGGTDLLIRGFAPAFAEALGGNVYVSNMAGGSGTVAAGSLAEEDPDGYRLGYWSMTVATVQPQIKDVPYDKDSWTPICSIAASPMILFTNAGSPFKTIDDAVEAVKDEPGRYLFGSSGPGAMTHLAAVAAFEGLGVLKDVRHLPFQGSGPALQAMAAGTIQFYADTEILMNSGDFRPLVVFAPERLESYPEVPTAAEAGIEPPLAELDLWGGLFAPHDLDPKIRDQLSEACGKAVASDEFQAFAERTATVLNYRDAESFDVFFRKQYDDNKVLIEAAGL